MESWITEYAADHAETNRWKELQGRILHLQSPQLQYRSQLVSWIRSVSEKVKYTINTVHLAVCILDNFMDNHFIETDRLYLVALVSLSISAKYLELESHVPKTSDFLKLFHKRFSPSEYRCMEMCMLRFLDWRLDIPTASLFADYYALFAVTLNDWIQSDISESTTYEVFWNQAQQAVKEYLDLSLLDERMLCYQPSIVACACILLARQQLRLSVKWTKELVHITRYTVDDLVLCANNVLSSRSSSCPDLKRKYVESPDHGYASGYDSCLDASVVKQRTKVRKRL